MGATEMTPLEALKEAEKWRSLGPVEMAVLCQGYRAALAEIEALKTAKDEAWRITEAVRDEREALYTSCDELQAEADRLAGLLKQVEWRGEHGCVVCNASWWAKHTDNCPAFTPDGEVKRAP